MKKTFLLLASALAVSAVIVVTAGATSTATPGVTAKSILLEGTFPLSGPASGYAPIPGGMAAYFSYVNAFGVNVSQYSRRSRREILIKQQFHVPGGKQVCARVRLRMRGMP